MNELSDAGSIPAISTKKEKASPGEAFFFAVSGNRTRKGTSVKKTVLRTVFSEGSCGSSSV